MEHYAGIDVSLEQSSVCVVDGTGRIVREAKVASEPEALIRFLGQLGLVVTRIGLEAGPLSQWLHAGLTQAGLEVVLLETRQVKAALSAMVVKTDRRDGRASLNCCEWAGFGRCTASRLGPRRSGRCWSGASSCRANSWMSS
jgi:transposase